MKQSFLPIENNQITILILGSLPGDKSLLEQQYYAHPQNRFWKIIKLLLQKPDIEQYEEKENLLIQNHIGLWDVCATAVRVGSMDTDILEEVPNNLEFFLIIISIYIRLYLMGRKLKKYMINTSSDTPDINTLRCQVQVQQILVIRLIS